MNAIYIAAKTPELVRAIVVEGPPLYWAERDLGVFRETFQSLKKLAEPALNVEQIAEEIARQMPQVSLAFSRTPGASSSLTLRLSANSLTVPPSSRGELMSCSSAPPARCCSWSVKPGSVERSR
jgi:hypothetical protein